jgi:hypothetical protein
LPRQAFLLLNMPAFAGHTTGRADFPHPAFRLASSQGPRRGPGVPACPARGARLRLAIELSPTTPDLIGRVWAHRQSPASSSSSKARQKSGPFPPPELPGLTGRTTLSDSRPVRCQTQRRSRDLRPRGSPPITRITLPACHAHYPDGSERVRLSIASPSTRPSPLFRRVGIHIFTFEACSGFTHVTARWIAQPPKAAFVTRLQPGQSPSRTARQLPDQSTTLWVESSSTGDTRLRGARNISRTHL